jgi:hypothetical protein
MMMQTQMQMLATTCSRRALAQPSGMELLDLLPSLLLSPLCPAGLCPPGRCQAFAGLGQPAGLLLLLLLLPGPVPILVLVAVREQGQGQRKEQQRPHMQRRGRARAKQQEQQEQQLWVVEVAYSDKHHKQCCCPRACWCPPAAAGYHSQARPGQMMAVRLFSLWQGPVHSIRRLRCSASLPLLQQGATGMRQASLPPAGSAAGSRVDQPHCISRSRRLQVSMSSSSSSSSSMSSSSSWQAASGVLALM